MEELLKVILEYGMGGVALVVLAYSNVLNVKLMYKLEGRQARVEEIGRSNSEKLDNIVDKVDRGFRLNESAVDSINACRLKNQLPYKSK